MNGGTRRQCLKLMYSSAKGARRGVTNSDIAKPPLMAGSIGSCLNRTSGRSGVEFLCTNEFLVVSKKKSWHHGRGNRLEDVPNTPMVYSDSQRHILIALVELKISKLRRVYTHKRINSIQAFLCCLNHFWSWSVTEPCPEVSHRDLNNSSRLIRPTSPFWFDHVAYLTWK